MLSFYASLNGYVDVFAPAIGNMIGRSYADRSPESWLEVALAFANQVPEAKATFHSTIHEVKALVSRKRYQEARRIIQRGIDDAEAQIRHIG
jgi:hypothetical protein